MTIVDMQRYQAPSLSKALEILEYVAKLDRPLSLSELAKALDRSVTEIYRIVVVLKDRGYLLADERKWIRLNTRALTMRQVFDSEDVLLEKAIEVQRQLSERTRESSFLSVVSGLDAVVVSTVSGTRDYDLQIRLGCARPLWASPTGLAMLAVMLEGERERYFHSLGDRKDQPSLEVLRERVSAAGHTPVVSDTLSNTAIGEHAVAFQTEGGGVAALSLMALRTQSDPKRDDLAMLLHCCGASLQGDVLSERGTVA